MTPELVISDISSLNFYNVWQAPEQEESVFVHRIAPTDPIRVQFGVSANAQTPNIVLVDVLTGAMNELTPVQVGASDEYRYYNVDQTIAQQGCYRLEFRENNYLLQYAEFQVTDDLAGTKLFRYNNYRNEAGVVFTPDSPFYIRLKARLFPQNISFGAESNTFRDQAHALRLLSGNPTTTYKLLFGGDDGAPVWYGGKINRIFSLSEVLVDGEEYVRSDSAEVEVQSIADTYPMFNFALDLEKAESGARRSELVNYDPTYEPDGDIEVRVMVMEPAGVSELEIDPTWIEAAYNDTAAKTILVTAPNNNWTVSAGDSSWLTATKISQTQAAVVLTQNDGAAERTQNVTFTWIDANGVAHTQVLAVLQAYQGDVVGSVVCQVAVFSSSNPTSPLINAAVRLYDTVTGQTFGTGSTHIDGTPASIVWNTTQSQYDAATLAIEATKDGYSTGVSNLITKPDFATASTGVVAFPNIDLTEIEPEYDIEVRVEVFESFEFSANPIELHFPKTGGIQTIYITAPDDNWSIAFNNSPLITVSKIDDSTISVYVGNASAYQKTITSTGSIFYGDQRLIEFKIIIG